MAKNQNFVNGKFENGLKNIPQVTENEFSTPRKIFIDGNLLAYVKRPFLKVTLCALHFEPLLAVFLFFNAALCSRANSEEGEQVVTRGVVIV